MGLLPERGPVRARILAAVLLCGGLGCSDPFEGAGGRDTSCLTWHVRDPGPACTIPKLAASIDGQTSEWEREDLTKIKVCEGCGRWVKGCTCRGGDVARVQFARVSDEEVAFRLITHGAPITNGTVQYALALRRNDLTATSPFNYQTVVAVTGDKAVFHLNGTAVEGFPLKYAFSKDGLELRLPQKFLPYDGAMFFDVILLIPQASTLTIHQYTRFSIKVCWDAESASDPCAFN